MPVDYASFFQKNHILLIGENHIVQSHRREILAHLDELKKAGVTHIFIEGISANRQSQLDLFSKNMAAASDAVGTLSMEAFVRAKELGFSVIAMDMPASTIGGLKMLPLKYSDRIVAERDVFLRRRNRFMAQMIAKTLKREPGAKIMAIVGAAHDHALHSPLIEKYQGSTSIAEELSLRHGAASITIRLIDRNSDPDEVAAGLISEQRLNGQRFFIPLGPDGGLLHVSFQPHLSTLPIPE